MYKLSDREIKQVGGGDNDKKTILVKCSYFKNGSLVKSGSSNICPTFYDEISKTPGATLIERTEEWGYDEVTLEMLCK